MRALVSSLQARWLCEDLVEMMAERGLSLGPYDHYALGVAIRNRVREALEARFRPGGRPVMEGWTRHAIRQNSRRMVLSLSCRDDRAGRTVDFRLSAKRDDVAAAKAFFRKAIKGQHRCSPDDHSGRLCRVSPRGA